MSVPKWLIILGIIMAVSQCARAEDLGFIPNEAKGRIVITDEVCRSGDRTFDQLRRIYAIAAWGLVIEGCYGLDGDEVDAVFVNREKRRYKIKDFTKGLML